MTNKNKPETAPVIRERLVHNAVAVPGPEDYHTSELKVAMPPGCTLLRTLSAKEVRHTQSVKIESREQHDGIVRVVLDPYQDLCKRVILHDLLVVRGREALQEPMRDGEEGYVLDIWVMLWVIRNEVVDIVVVLPPAGAQAAHIRGDGHGNCRINREIVGYAYVSSIVDSECKLVPETSKRDGARDVPASR